MPRVIKKKTCIISPPKAFDIVLDFEQYPQFLPWCNAARLKDKKIIDENRQEFTADLAIKYALFSEVFTTKISSDRQKLSIDIVYLKGPFKHLNSYWRFNENTQNTLACDIEFMIDFEMKFGPLQKIITLFFQEAMEKMIDAFEKRFQQLSL